VNDGARLRIRRALTGDDGVLGELNAYVHQAHAAAMPDEYRPYATDAAAHYFAGVVEDDSHPIWIAEVDNFPVAYLEAEVRSRPDNPFTTELRVLYVHQLAVAEHARRLGVGRALMLVAESTAPTLACTEVRLEQLPGSALDLEAEFVLPVLMQIGIDHPDPRGRVV
jgi:GNAT superfamily N-acetyltransferase